MFGLFSSKSQHPLADEIEVKRIISELPGDDAFRALDEIMRWLDTLDGEEEIPLRSAARAVARFDEAARPHIRRLSKDYLTSPRLSKNEERRLWSINYLFRCKIGKLYLKCLAVAMGEEDPNEGELGRALPLLSVRSMVALGRAIKWAQFHYEQPGQDVWRYVGMAYAFSENGVFSRSETAPYVGIPPSSAENEFARIVAFAASSMDRLTPTEVEIAERAIALLSYSFRLSASYRPGFSHWVDIATDKPPTRIVRDKYPVGPTIRYFSFGEGLTSLDAMARTIEGGGNADDLTFNGQYSQRQVMNVLKHLRLYWSPKPPTRRHDRHRVRSRMTVLGGLDQVRAVFGSGEAPSDRLESWVVENVSLGGFGATVGERPGDWLRIGALLALQPEGGDNWLIGVVRRFLRESENQASVGIQTLAKQAVRVELKGFAGTVVGLRLDSAEAAPNEVTFILPAGIFGRGDRYEAVIEGQKVFLETSVVLESGHDYDMGRFKMSPAGDE